MREYFEKIYNDSKINFYEFVKNRLETNKKMFIITANPETIIVAQKDKTINKALLDNNSIVVADGIGIKKGAKILKYNIKETIPGIEICSKLLEYSNEFNKKVFLLGAKEEVLKKLVDVIKIKYPNLIIAGYENGYTIDKQNCINEMIKIKPDVILVALGIPIQEKLIYENLSKFEKGIFIGVGGSFDVLSGMHKRAPKIFRDLNLEWLYRILKEPKRIKRFVKNNVVYVLKILKEK